MKEMRNAINKWGFSILAALLLLCLVFGASAEGAAAEAPLNDYAQISYVLNEDSKGASLPTYVENGQKLFFRLAFDMKDKDGKYPFREAYRNGEVGPDTTFYVDIGFLDFLGSNNYPTAYDDGIGDNIASDGGEPVFRWWVDEDKSRICLRFFENIFTKEGDVSNTAVAFDGTLHVENKTDNGKINFVVNGENIPLQMRAGYELTKAAGVPYFSTDASSYLVDYTVTLTLDQHMKLFSNADNQMYCAALTLVDSVVANGALTGEIYGDAVVTAPEGESASAAIANNVIANTLTLSSPDQILNKGDYTIKYTMKLDSEAALAKLSGYTEAQKTNTVELKENGSPLKMPLTATATIAWDDVTDNQFKIDKSAFTEKAPDYKGVYWDKDTDKYYIDFRVVVYVREPIATFTVTDHSNYSLTFRNVPTSPVLEGVDLSTGYWNNDISTAALTKADATVTSRINDAAEMVITVSAPEGQLLPPGAYHLRVPADVTGAVETTLKNSYPQSYSNTAFLTSVDGLPTTESKEFKQAIPNRAEPRKDGGYAVNSTTGELLYYNGKPVIRWDVWFGWDFYDKTSFVDTLTGMEMLINSDYPFEIHSFTDQNHHKERLASISSLTDTAYLDFAADGTGFTFANEKLYTNADGTPVKLYKLVYFTTPLDAENELGYVNTDLSNGYSITHTTLSGKGFGTGPIAGEVEPDMTSQGRLYVRKKHVIERTDSLTQWLITCDNATNKVPFARFDNLNIIDLVPQGQTPIGEVTIHYSDDWPIEVEMVCSNNQRVTLTEGTHYSIVKSLNGYDFGENGEYGFAVVLDMDEVAAVLASQNCVYFKTIEVKCYLNNETHSSGQNYRIKNDGWLDYTNQGVELKDGVNAEYTRSFAKRVKGAEEYKENYNPNADRAYYVCPPNGPIPDEKTYFKGKGGYGSDALDGQKEIVWRITLSSRAFSQNSEPLKVTVTDTISDNQMFPVYDGKTLKDQFLIRNGDYIIMPDSLEHNDKSFTLTFTVPVGSWVKVNGEASAEASETLYIYYHTILTRDALQEVLDQLDAADKDASTLTIEYSNTASTSWNGESSGPFSAKDSAVFENVVLNKTAKFMQSAGNKVGYTIEMNPLKLDLDASSDVLQLQDTMGDGKDVFVYLENTFKLTNLDTGMQMAKSSSVSDSTYVLTMAEDGKSFTIDVPDETPLKLTYQVKTTQPVGTQDVKLNNTASLAGRTGNPIGIEFDVSASYQSGSFSVNPDEAAVRILKISSEDAEKETPTGLAGAEFSVTELNADGTDKGAAVTMTTNSEGIIELRRDKLSTEAVYFLIEETDAPDGYMIGEEAWKGCYAFVPTNVMVTDATLDDLKEATGCTYVTVIRAGSYADELVENEPASIIIHKVDEDGNTLPGATFVLKDADRQAITPTDDTVAGKIKFTGLRAGAYTLEETKAPDGYKLPENASWNLTIGKDGKVTVEAGSVGGLLSVSDDGFTVTVVNKSTGNLAISKTVSSTYADHATKEFTFTVTLSDTSITGTFGDIIFENGVATVLLKQGDTKTASDLPAGVSYTIVETEVPGFTATKSGDTGTIVKGETATAAFTNTYGVEPTTASFPVKKVLSVPEGMAGPKTWSYTINVKANDGAPVAEPMSGTVSNTNDTVTFGDFTYTAPGTYTYTVTETGTVAGVTNDSEAASGKTVTVTVVDNGDGTLTATADSTDDKPLTFTNTYGVEPTTASFPVKKVLSVPEGMAGPAEWSYTINVEANDGAPMTGTVSNTNDTVTFGDFTYTAPGEYTYTVKETGTVAGVTNDSEAASGKTVTVTVVDNGDGTLTATASATEDEPLTFTNTYGVEPTTVSFPVKKVLEVPAGLTGSDITGKFTFTLTAEDGVPMPTATEYSNPDADGGVVTFGEIRYTRPGKYIYTVKETGTVAGVTNDATASKTVTVTVVEKDGVLTATASATKDAPLTFTNTYGVEPTTVSFPVKKVLSVPEGMAGPAEWSYTISVKANDGASMTGTVSNTNDTVTFGDFTYNEPGKYTYTVTETGTVAGVTNDSEAASGKTVTVTVVDNGDGTLTATANSTEEEPLTFTNTYGVEPTTASFPVKKVLSVPEGMAGPKTWSYTINVEANDGAPEAKTMTGTVSNTSDTVTFGDFTYTAPGTYTYTVTETGTVDGVTNDNEAATGKTVTVTVVEKGGVLTATVDSTANAPLTFTNTYKAEPVELALQVEKDITGRDLVAGEFSFTLQEKGGNKTLTAQNAANGTVVFPAIEYTAVGEYVYTITETEGNLGGVEYDTHAVTATVTVTDNGKGALEAKATYSGETTFTNIYTASGALELKATKTVNGAEPREDEVFSFELCDAEGKVLQTKQNAKATITFEALGYTQADVDKNFLYTVREKQEDKSGYTLDETEYTVVVWVDDNSDGTLKVTKAITSDGKAKEAMTFDNTYAAEGEWTPTAVKTVNGAEPREDQVYKFALTDAEGNAIPAENAKGQISFGTLTYDLSDVGKTYTYTVQEITTSTDLLAVDESIYTVDVTVTDNKDGTLAVQPVITKDGERAQEISFANTLYAPLTISKTVEGCETAEAFPFTVELYDADGTEATGEYAYSGDVEGKLKSGDAIELAHGQSVTISGLLPGMTYTVTEAATAAFETTVNGNAGNSMEGTLVEDANEVSFVNKFKTTMFTVKKSWQGGGGGAIELTLYANGEKLDPQPAYTREENTYLYTDLPMYDEQEQPIVYSAKEKYVDGFLTIYSNVAPYADETKAIYDGGTIINKAIIKADFSVKKEWTGLAEGETAPEITLVLYCNGVATDIKTPKPDRNGWYKYYDLPGEVDDQPAVYTVKEMAVDGYMTSYKLANGTSAEYADNNGTIINAKIPQTGDETPLALWLTLMSASAAMLMLLRKRRKA